MPRNLLVYLGVFPDVRGEWARLQSVQEPMREGTAS